MSFFAEPENNFQIREVYILKYSQFFVLFIITVTDMVLLNLIYIINIYPSLTYI